MGPAQRRTSWILAIALSLCVLIFQNCGPAKLSSSTENLSSASQPSESTPTDATPAPASALAVPVDHSKPHAILACSSSTFLNGSPCQNAYDQNLSTIFNAGTYLAWIEFDLGSLQDISKLTLAITQSPAGYSVHNIYYGATPAPNTVLGNFSQNTQDDTVLVWTGNPIKARFLRVETTSNPSWTGWKEVQFFP
jgi:hypothetical protein